MIQNLSISNFKIFNERLTFNNLRALTIITGINGRGKSSMIQPMVAIAQSAKATRGLGQLCLNGDMIELGTAMDVKNEESGREKPTVFSFNINNCNLEFSYSFEDEKASYLTLKSLTKDNAVLDFERKSAFEEEHVSVLRNVVFISADRIPPTLSHLSSNDTTAVGSRGEYAVCAFYHNKHMPVEGKQIEYLPNIFPEVVTENLDRTVAGMTEFWLERMFRPTRVDAGYVQETNSYTLSISNLDRAGKFKPTNVGFGYSYAFPIIVAGLLAKEGDILIIENPEAHLHPGAQSAMGKFLAWLTTNGVQVFAETHSEHIVNAPRVLIVQQAFDFNNLGILYFDETLDKGVTSVTVLETGRIKQWPDGFFDQMEKDNDIILSL